MEAQCQDCNHKFFLAGSDLDNLVSGGGCPSCGGNQIYRSQPTPTNSDMEARNMVDPASGKDMGGNPLKEGILADDGWQNRGVRDESYASVRTANTPEHGAMANVHPEHGIHNGPLYMLSFLDAHVNGKPARQHGDSIFAEHSKLNPQWKGEPVQVHVHHPEHLPAAIEEIGRGIGPSKPGPEFRKVLNGIRDGSIPPPPGISPDSIKQGSTHQSFDLDGFTFNEDPEREPTHKIIVDHKGSVHSLPEPTTHEEVADAHNRDLGAIMPYSSLGIKYNDNSTDWVTHQSGHTPEALSSHLAGHFGEPVTIDPNLKPTTHEERFFGEQPAPQGPRRELDILQGPPRPRGNPPTYPVSYPGMTEGLIRGGSREPTHDMEPVIPWQYEESDAQHEAALQKDAFLPALPAIVGLGARVAPWLLKGALANQAVKGIGNLLGGGAPQQGAPSGAGLPDRPFAQLSAYESPSSVPSIGTKGGPEDVDPHEFNDGDNAPNLYDPTTNDDGGTDNPFTHEELWNEFQELLPDILDYAQKDKSALEHPRIRALHEKAEALKPGYHTAATPMPQSLPPNAVTTPGVPPIGTPVRAQPQVGPHALTGKCLTCGSVLHADGSCPQCGLVNQQNYTQPQPAPGQPGPGNIAPQQGFTPQASVHVALVMNQEQMAAVAELLESQGRHDEIVEMIRNPELYSDELAQIANDPNEPPTADPAAAAPPPPPPGMPPEMMGGGPPGGPGGDPSMQLAAAVARFAADSIAPRCPNCNSATTGILDEKSAQCHHCGKSFDLKGLIKERTRVSDRHDHAELHAPIIEAVPAADQERPEDVERETDSSGRWTTEDGAPLKVGKEYEMASAKYDIPDVVRIEAVKPDHIEYTLVGEYGLEHRTEISRQEAEMDGLTFTPMDHEVEEPPSDDLETNQDSVPTTAPGEISDLSDSPRTLSSSAIEAGTITMDKIVGGTIGTSNLTTTSAPMSPAAAVEQARQLLHQAGLPIPAELQEPQEPTHEVTSHTIADEQPKPHLAWLMNDSSEAIPFIPLAEQRTAGRKMTPMEQREYIDEPGEARNRDLLQLEGTHYKTRDTFGPKVDPSRVRDEDLFLGL